MKKYILLLIIPFLFSCEWPKIIDGLAVAPCNCDRVERGYRLSDEWYVGPEKSYVGEWKDECEKLKKEYTSTEWSNYLNENCW